MLPFDDVHVVLVGCCGAAAGAGGGEKRKEERSRPGRPLLRECEMNRSRFAVELESLFLYLKLTCFHVPCMVYVHIH